MFRTKFYYGVDLDLELLEQGLARYEDETTFGIHADLAKLEAIPDNSADVVVSTNTLYQLESESQKKALAHLCRIVRSDGKFICQLDLGPDLETLLSIIRSNFLRVKIRYYRNPISRFYEWIFEQDGFLGSHPIAGRRPFRLLAWLLSRLEFLTWRSARGNRRALIVGSQKIGEPANQVFDLSAMPLKDRIYQLT